MARGWVHTVPKDGDWTNEIEGDDTVGETYPTKTEAVARGRTMALAATTEHVIHNADGTIGERNSYGNDPRDIPG